MRNTILFITGLIFALWFILAGMVWFYWAALFIGYPIGAAALGCWYEIRNENKSRTRLIPILVSVGLVLSLCTLTYLLIEQ